MSWSDKLNGFWKEGYHYYLEFNNEKLTVRNYRREIAIETTVSYDSEALDSGKRTIITLADNVLSRTWDGDMMTEIKELAYENGELKMLYYYTIMGETLYTLKKVSHGPFDHIRILDDEYIEKLQGEWIKWSENPSPQYTVTLRIKDRKLCFFDEKYEPFHAVSYSYCPEKVYLVPANLTDDNFRGYTKVEVLPDMLTTTMMVCDASMPLYVFARKDKLDSIEVPSAAKRPMVNTMQYNPPPADLKNSFVGMMRLGSQETAHNYDIPDEGFKFCPECGYNNSDGLRFCPECGNQLKK